MVAEPKVQEGSDNRQTKGARKVSTPETDEVAAIRDYWTAAKKRYKTGDFPDYGTPDWCALELEDPRKMAGLVAFAQMWRKYGDEIAADLNRRLQTPHDLWSRPTLADLDQAHADMLARARRATGKKAA
ncbi:hypothetical protein C1N81_32025 [Streptomyces sp. SGAir0957]